MGQLRLGVDIGGTFTDLLLADDNGVLMTLKTPSVPQAPEQAVMNGMEDLIKKGVDLRDVNVFIHGTTLAVNTLIERKGCKTALLVTRGFRDVLEMRRLRLENTIDIYSDKTLPLVPREYVIEIDERVTADGIVRKDLCLDGLDKKLTELMDKGVESVAVSFLHAYKNPVHEKQVKAYIRKKFPQLYISISSEIWPQQKEYERTLVTVINSYIGQKMKSYFESLIEGCSKKGLQAGVLSTMSNGGIMTAESAAIEPVRTLLSGPASGVIGAAQVAKQVGVQKIITFDMGGTSADIAVINGTVNYSTDNKVGDFPVIIPAVDVTAIGAGGGSIAWIDDAGILKVGPESAGAAPGPVAYNHGGTRPALTSAFADLKQDYVFTTYKRVDDFAAGELTGVITRLKNEGSAWIDREAKSGIKLVDIRYEYSFDMRFAGQAFELKVMMDADMFEDKAAILKRFRQLYKTLFGVEMKDAKVEIINVRVTAIGVTEKGGLEINVKRKIRPGCEKRQIYFDHRYQEADVMSRFALQPNEKHAGPAILTAYDTTIFIPAEFDYYSDKYGNIIGEMRDE